MFRLRSSVELVGFPDDFFCSRLQTASQWGSGCCRGREGGRPGQCWALISFSSEALCPRCSVTSMNPRTVGHCLVASSFRNAVCDRARFIESDAVMWVMGCVRPCPTPAAGHGRKRSALRGSGVTVCAQTQDFHRRTPQTRRRGSAAGPNWASAKLNSSVGVLPVFFLGGS